MIENEVIIVDAIDNDVYDSLIESCVKYALISLPFTVDRMAIPNEIQRTFNIAKGKIAEALFKYFCEQNNIEINFEDCETPFWTVDKRDFLLNGNEWDIKNNFFYCPENHIEKYINLPALVPNRFKGDQWSKRNEILIDGSLRAEFLFTLLKGADLIDNNRENDFLEITISDDQETFIRELYAKYKGQPQINEPYTENWFWDEMAKRGDMIFYILNFRPPLIITGFANEDYWHIFKDTGPYDRDNNYQNYLNPRWYTKSLKGFCNFMNGTMWTTITNATSPCEYLPSFLSLFPHLNEQIFKARIKG